MPLVSPLIVPTPIAAGVEFTSADCPKSPEEQMEMSKRPYSSLVGAMNYVSQAMRPDIGHAIMNLSRFLQNPGKRHWDCARRCLNYLIDTKDIVLEYKKMESGMRIEGYSDSDWGGDKDGRKSTSGYVWMMCGRPISWKSKLQPCVTLSSTEAKYVAMSPTCQEGIWLRNLLEELSFPQPDSTLIMNSDNQGAIALTGNPRDHPRTRHISIRYHFARWCIRNANLSIKYVPTASNIADILTKYVVPQRLQDMLRTMGMVLRKE
jgi:hypothetical protein